MCDPWGSGAYLTAGFVTIKPRPAARRSYTPDGCSCNLPGMTPIELEAFLPYRLNRIAAAMSKRFRAVYRDQAGLTVPGWRVLATLAQFDSLMAKDIGCHSDMHKTKVSRAVRELERRHWLRRRANPADRREAPLMLTAEGRRAYDRIAPEMLAMERRLLAELGPTTSATLPDVLGALERALALGVPPR
jgi:DNA-binding MarR family transcriptional regulator